jgi:hypothetical protein
MKKLLNINGEKSKHERVLKIVLYSPVKGYKA